MAKRRRLGAYGAAAISVALLGGCALVAGLFEPKPPYCGNGVKDEDETDVDCGGACPKCDGAKCENNDDCRSLNCADGECRSLTCYPGSKDPCDQCHSCEVGKDCASNLDCASGLCSSGQCATCTGDGQCPGEGKCSMGGLCVNVTCNNGVQNTTELGKDCGNECETYLGKACPDGGTGGTGTGGTGTGGTGGTAPTCHDNVQNGDETSIDCGGPCLACQGDDCVADKDCVSGICDTGSNKCVGCFDKEQNGDETDEDCGGHDCDPCVDGKGCVTTDDCMSGYCNPMSKCSTPSCTDGFLNQNETGVDCGGVCGACNGVACVNDSNCSSGKCVNQVCRAMSCSATVYTTGCGTQNGDNCATDTECWSGHCAMIVGINKCVAANCFDNTKNGDETDTDCGGSCFKCGPGKTCNSDSDCMSGKCITMPAPAVCM